MASKAIPSHLKPQSAASNGGDPAEFARKHHGKSQSHVVSNGLSFLLVIAEQAYLETGSGHEPRQDKQCPSNL
jgi:hypothetical protein